MKLAENSSHFLFLDLLELFYQSSKTIAENLLDCLNKHSFDDKCIKENFVTFTSVTLKKKKNYKSQKFDCASQVQLTIKNILIPLVFAKFGNNL